MSAGLATVPVGHATTEHLATAERMLAEVKSAEDAQNVMAAADFAADLARRVELGTASVNHALAIKAKAMRKLADVVDEGQAKGEIAKPGDAGRGRPIDVRSADIYPAPSPVSLPLPRQRLAECRQIRDAFTEDELEQHFAEATERDKELPTRALVKLAKQTRPPVAAPQPPRALAGTFATLVADPPWKYGNTSTRAAAQDHYDTLSIAQLCGDELLPDGTSLTKDVVLPKVADRAHLYLWTTSSHLPDAFSVMAAWGFTYKTYLVWVKPQMGMGNYFRVSTELVLFGVRGEMRTQDMGLMNYFTVGRGKHSAKPQAFYDLVAKASPGPHLEMFARCDAPNQLAGTCQCSHCRLGWEVWGNQA
jgi:N6-adenosine-specific RNA methylase IME4